MQRPELRATTINKRKEYDQQLKVKRAKKKKSNVNSDTELQQVSQTNNNRSNNQTTIQSINHLSNQLDNQSLSQPNESQSNESQSNESQLNVDQLLKENDRYLNSLGERIITVLPDINWGTSRLLQFSTPIRKTINRTSYTISTNLTLTRNTLNHQSNNEIGTLNQQNQIISTNNITSTTMTPPTTSDTSINNSTTSLKDLYKLPAAILVLPKRTDEIEQAIESWEMIMETLNADQNAKTILLKTAIDKADLRCISRIIRQETSYDKIRDTLIQQTKTPDMQYLYSPEKKDPVRAFHLIKKLLPNSAIDDKIAALKAHLSEKEIKRMELTCASETDVENHLTRLDRRSRTSKHKSKKKKNKKSTDTNTDSSSSTTSTSESESDTDESDHKNKKKKSKSKDKKSESEIQQLITLVKQLTTDKTSTINQIQSNFNCRYHQNKGTAAYRCDGPNCSNFNSQTFTNKDDRSYYIPHLLKQASQQRYQRKRAHVLPQTYPQYALPQNMQSVQPFQQIQPLQQLALPASTTDNQQNQQSVTAQQLAQALQQILKQSFP